MTAQFRIKITKVLSFIGIYLTVREIIRRKYEMEMITNVRFDESFIFSHFRVRDLY